MRLVKFSAFAVVAGMLLATGTAAIAESTGKVRAIRGTAAALGLKGERALVLGSGIGAGDLVSTGQDGVLQIAFSEETRLVVGEASAVKVEAVKLEQKAGGKELNLDVLDGSFRFISDDKGDKDFKIRTPSATIALTGTALDLTVTPSGGTRMLLLDGEVTMCGTGGNRECRTVATPCAMLRAEKDDSVEEVAYRRPRTPGEESAAADAPTVEDEIRDNFPYQRSQRELLEEFRVAGLDCLPASTGGLAQAPLEESTINISPVVPFLIIGGGGVACLVFCKGGPTSNSKTN